MAGHCGRFTASFQARSRLQRSPRKHSGRGQAFHPDATLKVKPRGRRPRSAPTDDRSERPAKVLEAVQTLLYHVKARRVTEPNGAIIAEGSARYDGDIGFAQQTVGKILRSESKLADVYQYIKCPLRFD